MYFIPAYAFKFFFDFLRNQGRIGHLCIGGQDDIPLGAEFCILLDLSFISGEIDHC